MLPRRIVAVCVFSLAPQGLFAQQRFDEAVVVTGTAEPLARREMGRAVEVVSAERIEALPTRDAADAVRLAGNVDVRARGEAGVQADFSIRGASFGQTLVLVDGLRLNDAQTGHHNADLPVPLSEIERIEVLAGPGSALYGADALGGVVQVITRTAGPRASAQAETGSFGAVGAAAAGHFGSAARGGNLAVSTRRSDGFIPDRDHRLLDASARLRPGPATRLVLAVADKEFGAAGFYGPAPSREWTRQALAAAEHAFSSGERLAGAVSGFFRAHDDRFVYDVNRPALSDNRHDSHAAGMALRLHRAIGAGRLSAGMETGADWVDSSALGERGYGRVSTFAEAALRHGGLAIRPGLRFDAYGRFGTALSPSLAAAGPLRDRLRWRASAGRAFRVPTFTELYYRDPNHRASDDLRPERAWAADAGLDLEPMHGFSASLTGFARFERDVIEWARSASAEPWSTRNVREARTGGIEGAAGYDVSRLSLRARYTWLQTVTPGLPVQTKYVADFTRHALRCDAVALGPGGLRVAPSLEYRRKADGRRWWLLDARLSRELGRIGVWIEGRNLLDQRYEEIRGVAMPGRALAAGIRGALPGGDRRSRP